MARVELSLLGKAFPVQCEDGEESRVEALAGYVDGKLRQLAGSQSSATETRLCLLACLMLADEVFDLKAKTPKIAGMQTNNGSENEQALLAAVEHLTARVEKLAERLDSPVDAAA